MKWEVTGAWKADGAEASMTVEAPNQRAAEVIAAQRGMMVEQAIPQGSGMPPVTRVTAASYAAATAKPETAGSTMKAIRLGLFVGWLLCLFGAFAFPPLGYAFGALLLLWIVMGFAGLFVK